MTDREQVIAELLYLKHDCLEGSSTDQTLDKAIALLKAQEAVEPIRKVIGCGWRYFCGKCGNSIVSQQNYCQKCGQAVKWK